MKSVIVTGGTIRVGKAIADCLRAEGWNVLVSSHRDEAGADIVADLSEPMGAAKLYSAALNLLGGRPPDALVNNAALFVGNSDAIDAVNNIAPRKLTVLMAGREEGVGAVVNVLDSAALRTGSLESFASDGYLESKRNLLTYTKESAITFAATLRVNAVAPGPVIAPTEVHEKAGDVLLDSRPKLIDVAHAVSFLLGAEATTGCVIPVDSGQYLLDDCL